MSIKRVLLTLLVPLFVLSASVQALVVDLKGLPKDTTFTIDLGGGNAITGKTDANGNATLSDDDDDDPAGLLLPRDNDGNLKDGNYPIIDTSTGDRVGTLKVNAGVVTSTIAALNFVPDSGDQSVHRVSVQGGYVQLSFKDTAINTIAGGDAATVGGFDVDVNTNDTADGFTLGLGYSRLASGQFDKQGAITIDTNIQYNQFQRIKGSFLADSSAGSLISSGGQKAKSIGVTVGPSIALIDNVVFFAHVGLILYDLKDSGSIIIAPDGPTVDSFSDDRTDDTATFGAGLRYTCDDWFAQFDYNMALDDIGFAQDDAPSTLSLTFGYWFDL